jgi:hypothetical protein
LEYLYCLGLVSYTSGAAWEGFAEEMPDPVGAPRRLIVCSTTTPNNLGTFMLSGRVVQRYGVQIRLAGLDSTDYTKCAEIQKSLAASHNSPRRVILDAIPYTIHRAALSSGPLRMGRDKEGRYGFSLNYLIAITV